MFFRCLFWRQSLHSLRHRLPMTKFKAAIFVLIERTDTLEVNWFADIEHYLAFRKIRLEVRFGQLLNFNGFCTYKINESIIRPQDLLRSKMYILQKFVEILVVMVRYGYRIIN